MIRSLGVVVVAIVTMSTARALRKLTSTQQRVCSTFHSIRGYHVKTKGTLFTSKPSLPQANKVAYNRYAQFHGGYTETEMGSNKAERTLCPSHASMLAPNPLQAFAERGPGLCLRLERNGMRCWWLIRSVLHHPAGIFMYTDR